MPINHSADAWRSGAAALRACLAVPAAAAGLPYVEFVNRFDRPGDSRCVAIAGSGAWVDVNVPLSAHNRKMGAGYPDQPAVYSRETGRIRFPAFNVCLTALGRAGRSLAQMPLMVRPCAGDVYPARAPFSAAGLPREWRASFCVPTSTGTVKLAAVRVEAHERKRLVQLCRTIPRPALSDERVQLNAAGQVELKHKPPWRDGTTPLAMSPLESMQRLAALVPRPWPRLQVIRYGVRMTSLCEVSGPPSCEHGVLATNAKLRSRVVPQGPPAQAQLATEAAAATRECEVDTLQARPGRISWARLLKRVFDIDMQRCPSCGSGELKIIATILERAVIQKILSYLGLDAQPPPKGTAREPGLNFAA